MNIPIGEYIALLRSYLQPQRRRVWTLLVLVVAAMLLQIAAPQIIRVFIDEALGDGDTGRLQLLAGTFILVSFFTQTVAVANVWLSETIGWTATNALRADLADHCLRLDMSFHKTRTPGEMIQRIDGDVDGLSNFFSQFVLYLAGSLLLIVGVLVLLFLEDWRIGLSMTLFVLLALGGLARLRSFAVRHWVALREETAQFYGFLGEQLAGTEDIRGNGARPHSLLRFHRHLQAWLPLAVRSGMAFAWMWMASLAVFTAGSAAALVVSFYLWRSGEMTVGAVYLVFHYTELLRRPIELVREQVQELQAASASITRVHGLFQFENRLPDTGTQTLPAGALAVDFIDVGFAYEQDEPVLQDLSLSLRPGEVLGLLGRTGSGKTTIGRLLVRLYDNQIGRIELAGHELRDLPMSHLRERIGIVTQDVQLFEGTLRENLALYDMSIPDERLVAALESLGLRPWLDSLPQGLDTELTRGAGVSAGEGQLLACARAFLRDPGLVVMDEATSRLDPATQRLVDQAFGRLLAGRTAIIVAHRLATVDRADHIAVLEEGRLLEFGRREALLADPASRFHRLRQMDMEAQPA